MDENHLTPERLRVRLGLIEDFLADVGKIDECKDGFHGLKGVVWCASWHPLVKQYVFRPSSGRSDLPPSHGRAGDVFLIAFPDGIAQHHEK